MTWDLFSAAESAENEALARAVAAAQADAGFAADVGFPAARRPGAEWTVSAVNAAAREMVEGVFPPLRVTGEVANFTRARSGHCYFTLRDADAQLRCVMWREEARRLPTTPAEGMQVSALGRLTLYEARGEFQLVVSDLDGHGEGLWKLAFDRLRTKLDAEGLTSPERRRPVPRAPGCVGVATSLSGAALRDVLAVVRRRAPWTRVVVAGCKVQGEGAADEIAEAVRLLGRSGCADVLIVGRGGGSIEDLWAFNEEAVARAIAESPVPVISAVGHETDVTLADLVADLRAPTPSAAAEAAVPDGARVRGELDALRTRLEDAAGRHVAGARHSVAALGARLASAGEHAVRTRRERLAATAGRLHALSPLGVLARGYAVPTGPDGKLLRSAKEFAPGARFTLTVADGSVPCRVEDASAAALPET